MPTSNVAPGLWVLVTVAPQLSVAVGAVHVTAALHTPASLLTVMSAGVPEKTGSSPSVTVMSKLSVVSLPSASFAVYVTVVVPTGKEAPLI